MPFSKTRATRLVAPLVNTAALVIVIAGMRLAAPIVTQILMIVFITIIISPVYFKMVRWRFPSWLALTLIIASLSFALLYGIVSLTQALTQLARDLPTYHKDFREAIERLREWSAMHMMPLPDTLFDDIVNVHNVGGWARALVSFTGGLLGRGIATLVIVSFLLCEIASLPRKLREMSWMTDDLWLRMQHVVADVRRYMEVKTIVSIITGVSLYVGLILLRVDSPLLLGFLAFLLNFIPAVGSIIAGIPAVLLAYLNIGTGQAIAVVILYVAVNQLLGNILEPRLMGRSFGVSPVIILLSLLFWGWVLGPVGVLFSVPLTMGLRVMLVSLKDLTPETVTPTPPETPQITNDSTA